MQALGILLRNTYLLSEYLATPLFHHQIIFMTYALEDIAYPLFFLNLNISF